MARSSALQADVTAEVISLIKGNLDVSNFRDRYLGQCLTAKLADPDPKLAAIRAQKALEKWLNTEARNAKANQRLLFADDEKVGGLVVDDVLALSAKLIRKVIGTKVPLEDLYGTFSGGASTSKRRQPGIVARKYAERPDVTQEAWDYIWPWLYRYAPVWTQANPWLLKPRFVRGNVLFTVPKNDEIDRVACKEPDLNMFLQKAAGGFIRKRLRRVGVDLNDQGPNQVAAREASVDRVNATVDLSSASDSVTTQLVCRLLPVDWFVFLERVRCRETRLPDGTWHENEMIGSMGNGFVFELESLIFWALVKACGILSLKDGRVTVYGDDLIFRSDLVPVVRRVFQFVGFTMNVEKTFAKGPFRESCGKHFYSGVDVTPFYLREPIRTIPALVRVLNRIRAWAEWYPGHCDPRWFEVWEKISQYIPNKKLFGGYDLDSIETVASPTGPGFRFMRKWRSVRRGSLRVITPQGRRADGPDVNEPGGSQFDIGLYLEWQAEANLRGPLWSSDASSQKDVVEEDGFTVVRPRRGFASTFGLVSPAFPQEILNATGP